MLQFKPGDVVKARDREWVVLPETRPDLLRLRPLGGSDDDATLIYLPLEPQSPVPASFDPPDPTKPGSQEAAVLLRDALRLKLRAGAGPFRSFGSIAVEPRAYQLVPLLMALKLDTIRLLIADDVGIGKTIEAGLIARELFDRGEIRRLAVICPPHLCEQWRKELSARFHIEAEVVRTGTAGRLERGLRPDESIFEVYPYTVVSLDYIKSDRRRDDFLRACPEFVIVDEAHTCVHADTTARHQRYRLVKALADKPLQHMLFLTATPHSGDDVAFHNLLGLLSPRFAGLQELREGPERRALRDDLANYLVQRRRSDIAEWKDSVGFPTRERRESTYRLTGDWGHLFDAILSYARAMVQNAANGTKLEQRMSWWAALALLRCVSSSPAAAALALRTRIHAIQGVPEREQLYELDQVARETVLDGEADDTVAFDESVPAGTTQLPEEVAALRTLIARAEALRGSSNDVKLAILIEGVRQLLAEGFQPVVFCRYIATAHYVADHLRDALRGTRTHVIAVTSELTADRREDIVEELEDLEEGFVPILVATDCLSEGINLQRLFNAVIHYDLTWNPTRHEQREGRVDRFGQASAVVRTLMLYGEDNPVDGAVLRVILRKAEKIRRELGVAVPMPTDNNKVVDAILQAVLLQSGRSASDTQLSFGFVETEHAVDMAWAAARERITRTVFAQRKLKPENVLPEWRKAVSVLGGQRDVERFVGLAAQRLGTPLELWGDHARFPMTHLPKPLQERLEAVGLANTVKIAFSQPAPVGVHHVHRTHPLVATLADYIAEQTLDTDRPELGARCAAFFTKHVEARTALYLLRVRYHLSLENRKADSPLTTERSLLAEECLGVAVQRGEGARIVPDIDALTLLSSEPARNMNDAQKTQLVQQALDALPALATMFLEIAHVRAEELLADHRRVREASEAKGTRYAVAAAPPVDVIGAYVLMPGLKF